MHLCVQVLKSGKRMKKSWKRMITKASQAAGLNMPAFVEAIMCSWHVCVHLAANTIRHVPGRR